VTQPRKPCFKLALRFGGDQRIAPRMIRAGRTGWYFRVLEEGHLAEGDDLVLIARRHARWSIRNVNHAAYDGAATLETLRAIAALPELSTAWRSQTIAAATSISSRASQPAFREFVLSDAVLESRSIRSLTFAPADGKDIPLHEPGQHVQIRLPAAGPEQPAIRRYTISSPPNGRTMRISVKVEEKGRVSPLLHRLCVGDRIEMSRPQGRFILDRQAGRPVALVSAGVGITPMIPMLQAAVTQDGRFPFVPKILFVHMARNGADHAFADQVEVSLSKHPDAVSNIFYSRPTAEDRASGRFNHEGRISPAHLESFLTADYDFYLCGPVTFVEAFVKELRLMGIPASRIKAESFGASDGGAGVAVDATPPFLRKLKTSATVQFERSGKTVIWRPEEGTLLDLAEANDIAVSSDCRMGLCGTCSTVISSGEVTHLGLDGNEPAKDTVLLCRAVPRTDRLVLDL
jgi:ferredoxin-NADP reductase